MERQKFSVAGFREHIGRMTRSRTAAARENGGAPPLVPPKKRTNIGFSDENMPQVGVSSNLGTQQGKSRKEASDENAPQIRKGKPRKEVSDAKGNQKGRQKRQVLADVKNSLGSALNINKGKGKRPASEECTGDTAGTVFGVPNKRRAALRDVPNVLCGGTFRKSSFPVPKSQTKVFPEGKFGICKSREEAQSPAKDKSMESNNAQDMKIENEKRPASKEVTSVLRLSDKDRESIERTFLGESSCEAHAFVISTDAKHGVATSSEIANIDADKSNTRMCSVYASDIYNNFRANELIRRPSADFMERLQSDITQNMRAILIDWLVEVCDEYCLVPDTLYLTVYLIDRFLSKNKIERQQLQLLGISCMLIASKYEEICAPRVQEFCFITDNSYTRAEVLRMERQVLSLVGYNISVPTTKIFLRRFLRAAQASSKASPTMMHLANYLAELTLMEYSFVKYLPSVIASSAVFLAQWTLDQSTSPWNDTLQHYTCYKSCEIKNSILKMRELQVNTRNCTLKAIRQKYQQDKFLSVANLTSPELPDSLFC